MQSIAAKKSGSVVSADGWTWGAARRARGRRRTLTLLSAAAMAGLAATRAQAQVYLNGTLEGQTWTVSSVQSGNVTIFGDANTFTPSGGPALPDGTLIINDSATAGGASTDYFPSNTITMSGGSIDYIGNASSATTTTIPSLSVLTNANIATTPNGNLTIGNLATTGTSTITFRSVSGTLGGSASGDNILISQLNGNPSWTTNNGIIGGWATVASGTGATSFAAYGANGVSAVSSSVTSLNGAASSANVIDGGENATANATVNSLTSNGGDVDLKGFTLTLNSGGIIMGGASHWLKSSTTTSTLTAGSASNYTIFATVNDPATNFQFNNVSTINNGSNAVSFVKGGTGQLLLPNQSSFTGNVTVNAGILVASGGGNNSGNTDLGSDSVAGRIITVNNGATLKFTSNNVFGSGQSGAANIPSIVVTGGTLSSSSYDVLGNVTLSGATVTGTGTGTGVYQDFQFLGSVTVNGNAASTISSTGVSSTAGGDHLGSNTAFNVSSTGGSGADLTVSAPLRDQSGDFNSGAGGLTKTGNGTMALTGANTYTGVTTLNSGILNAGSLANGGTASGIGAGSAAASLVFGGGTLQFNSAVAASTNRLFTIGNANGNTATLDSSAALAADTMSFTSTGNIAFANAAPHTLTLTGSNTGANTFAPVIGDQSGGNSTSLVKSGSGSWALASSNIFTGATTVSAGTLIVDHSGSNTGALGNTAVSVSGGATLLVKGTTTIGSGAGGNVTLAGGATGAAQGILSLQDGGVNTLSIGGNLTVGGPSGGSQLSFDLGSSSGSNSSITVGGAVAETSVTSLNLNVLTTLQSGASTYTLINSAGGGIIPADFAINSATKPAGFNSFSLTTSTANALILSVQANATPTTAYWTGLASSGNGDTANSWGFGSALATAQSNWSTTVDGLSDPKQVPGAITNVVFTAAKASSNSGVLNTQLDSSYSINGITFDTSTATSPISGVTININGNTLTLGSGAMTIAPTDTSNTTLSGSGAGVLIGASENWANNSNTHSLMVSTGINGTAGVGSTQTLTLNGTGTGGITLSGAIGDGPNGHLALVFSQAGVTQLNNANTFTGGATINSGTVQLGNATSLGSAAHSTVAFGAGSTGVLSLNGNSVTFSDLNTNATVGSPMIQSGPATTGTDTLTLNNANNDTFAGVLQNGGGANSLALIKNGAGSLTLSGANTFSGGTTLNAGTVILGSATALGTATNAALTFGASSTGLLELNGNSITLTDLNTNATVGTPIIESGPTTTGTDTLTVTTANNDTFAGVLKDGSGTSPLAITKAGAGTLTLSNRSTFTGGTTVSGGVLTLAVGGQTGAITGNLTVNAGATVSLTAGDALGYAPGPYITNLNLNGGTIDAAAGAAVNEGYSTNFFLTGGFVTSTSGGAFHFFTGAGITSLASSATSIISAPLDLRNGGTVTITTASGTAPGGTDLSITGAIKDNGGIVKAGSGVLSLSGQNTFTGNIAISAGTLRAAAGGINGVSSPLGGLTSTTRTITVNTGATLSFATNDVFGNGTANAANIPAILANGGTVTANNYDVLGNITLSSGATLTSTAGPTGGYQQYQFLGAVTVNGTSASTISTSVPDGATAGGDHLGANTVFNVSSTGGSGADLTISAPLRDQSSGFNQAAGALTKTGSGAMALSGASTYKGGTTISAGTLALTPASGVNNIVKSAYVNVANGAVFDVSGVGGAGANQFALNGTGTQSTSQILGGAGSVNGSVAIANGATLSAGTNKGAGTVNNGASNLPATGTTVAIGALATGNLALGAASGASGNYAVKVSDAVNTGTPGGVGNPGAAGTNYDTVAASGISVPAAPASPFNVQMLSYGTLNAPVANTASANFDSTATYVWQIASYTSTNIPDSASNTTVILTSGGGQTADPAASGLFALDTSNFVTANPGTSAASFFLEEVGGAGTTGTLDIVYNATPEPANAALCLAGVMPMLAVRRRRRQNLASRVLYHPVR